MQYKNFISLVLYHLSPYKWYTAMYIFLASLGGLCTIFTPNISKYIIDQLVDVHDVNSTLSAVFWPAVLFAVNMEMTHLTWRGIAYINYKIQPVIKSNVIKSTFEYVIQHSHSFFQDNLAGKISNNINVLANNMERILHEIMMHIIRGIVLLIATLINMYFVHPQFFYGLLFWTIAFLCFNFCISKYVLVKASNYAESESQLSGQIVDRITNVANIRIFAQRFQESSNLIGYLDRMTHLFRRKEKFILISQLILGLSMTLMVAFMLYTLIKLRVEGLVTIGDYALILGLSVEVGYTLWWLTEQFDMLSDSVGKCRQSLAALFETIGIQDKPNAAILQVAQGRIIFDKVRFHYKSSASLFQNKSVTIYEGQKVGLVGYSGSGKTTFVNLILRMYDISEGRILIDGQDISGVTQESLRNNIAMIPQDPTLFHRSIMENIRYSRIDATDEEVINAAKRAHAHEFIMNLPEGYNSLVGERGIKLSGGQRQRIAIARAILKNSPILILDEATSQLDSLTENDIQDSLWNLMQDKTTIVIAHRLSTLLHMDRILVFEKGNIVGDGTHNELIAQGGLYKTLWEAQVGGFLPEKI